jgi:hypothetical protein
MTRTSAHGLARRAKRATSSSLPHAVFAANPRELRYANASAFAGLLDPSPCASRRHRGRNANRRDALGTRPTRAPGGAGFGVVTRRTGDASRTTGSRRVGPASRTVSARITRSFRPKICLEGTYPTPRGVTPAPDLWTTTSRRRGPPRRSTSHRTDDPTGATLAVREVRRDHQLAAAADLHALHALVPAGDDLADAERKERGAPRLYDASNSSPTSRRRRRSARRRLSRPWPRRRHPR